MSNGLDFERQVHALLKNMGFEAEITKASGDGGIDIIAHSKEHITGGKYIIQCKDWSKPVGEPPVRDLFGVVTAESANKGILITTSTFTSPAINFAAGKPLELIDGAKFSQLLAKYSLGSIQNTATDDERIKVLTEQLNKSPKNILVMKELADSYFLQGLYDDASELYEKMRDLKPSVETERLKDAYWGGLNNYGVTLAMKKQYDEASKLFKQIQAVQTLRYGDAGYNEATLLHYLGLFDIAIAWYQEMKMVHKALENEGAGSRDAVIQELEKKIEDAYLENPIECWLHLSGIESDKMYVPLDSPIQKAIRVGKQEIYKPIGLTCEEIINKYDEIHRTFNDTAKLGEESINDAMAIIAEDIIILADKCQKVIADGRNVLAIEINNPLQEAYRQLTNHMVTVVDMIHKSIGLDGQPGNLFCHSSEIANKNLEQASLWEKVHKEEKTEIAKWEDPVNKEKSEWREKLRSTIYANWTPKVPINASTPPQNKQCFIATAVYGSPFSPEVEALRQWRDRSLSTTAIGRSFISSYYKYSPGIARYIEDKPFIKRVVRKGLNGIVRIVRREERI